MLQALNTPQINKIFENYSVKKAALFGSYAKNENNPRSDIDILVQFEEGKTPSYFKFFDFEKELQTHFDKQIDIVTFNSLNKYLRDEIINTMKVFYEK